MGQRGGNTAGLPKHQTSEQSPKPTVDAAKLDLVAWVASDRRVDHRFHQKDYPLA
jgi:hypothetical protein